ncbi:MAG: GNAT family N-acetyltransferase [Bacteroidetes bacterium]|jgi:GNAT superfamily N-acetyltransferase|nr:GNAT family N-acetyltransferase [Bacteroidota bacterium]
MKKLNIVTADLDNEIHAKAVLYVTNQYARDPMGLGTDLPEETKDNLIPEMKQFPGAFSLIAFFDDEPAGVANCIYSFSTFNASKVINIHDLAVNNMFRGKGIGQALLGAVERKAKEENCCKVTLEVREDNRARNLYERMGYSYGKPTMYFMTKYMDE